MAVNCHGYPEVYVETDMEKQRKGKPNLLSGGDFRVHSGNLGIGDGDKYSR